MKEKQPFERLEVSKDTLLKMFKVTYDLYDLPSEGVLARLLKKKSSKLLWI